MYYEINKLNEFIPHSGNRFAIATMAVGDFHRNIWERFFKENWIKYAEKYHYDLYVVFVPLDDSEEATKISLTWQKCLILDQPWAKNYERLVWLDSDIAISMNAPNIVESTPDPMKIGISYEWAQLSLAEKHILMEIYLKRPIPYETSEIERIQYWEEVMRSSNYTQEAIQSVRDGTINSGVMVLSPQYHKELLKLVYAERRDVFCQEQIYLTHIFKSHNMLHEISPRFNWQMNPYIFLHLNFYNRQSKKGLDILPDIIQNELRKSYFLHFNGSRGLLEHLVESVRDPEIIFNT